MAENWRRIEKRRKVKRVITTKMKEFLKSVSKTKIKSMKRVMRKLQNLIKKERGIRVYLIL
ncbi:hypothetical protein TSUD_07890 [Trifolium subterraneum]|nr:hypothetical protein TSUD_07890 [Trifolium subterraneum]